MQLTPGVVEALTAATEAMLHKPLWLVLLKQIVLACPQSECQLCGALEAGIAFPGLVLQRETLMDATKTHDHWKYGEVEVSRHAAHGEGYRIVPDDDRPVEFTEQGAYRIGVYDGDTPLLWVDLPPMTVGATLSTLTVAMR